MEESGEFEDLEEEEREADQLRPREWQAELMSERREWWCGEREEETDEEKEEERHFEQERHFMNQREWERREERMDTSRGRVNERLKQTYMQRKEVKKMSHAILDRVSIKYQAGQPREQSARSRVPMRDPAGLSSRQMSTRIPRGLSNGGRSGRLTSFGTLSAFDSISMPGSSSFREAVILELLPKDGELFQMEVSFESLEGYAYCSGNYSEFI